MIRCDGHDVLAPRRLIAVAIVEGHVDHLSGTCGNCQQTLVGIDVGDGRPVTWFAVADVVKRERRYQHAYAALAAANRIVGDSSQVLQTPEAQAVLAATGRNIA